MKVLNLLIGALGGVSAMGPMTIVMEVLHRRLPAAHRYELPPREITNELERKAGVSSGEGEGKAALVLVNHFAYGAAAGAVYATLRPARGPALFLGPLFGAVVWLVSYFGLLPAVSLLKPATEHPAGRNGLMFVAHLVWGLLLGFFVQEVSRDRGEARGALVKKSPVPSRERA